MPPTISAMGAYLTLLALPGFGLSLFNTAGAYDDLRYHWRDGLRPVGWIGLAKVVLVLLMASALIAVGLIAMATPQPSRPEIADAARFMAVCLIGMDAMTLALAFIYLLERHYVVPHVHLRESAPPSEAP